MRMVVGLDSRVCVGAFTKGRSSSRRLNLIVRIHAGVCMSCRIYPACPWVSTHCDPAACPSCDAPLPVPLPVSPDMEALFCDAEVRSRRVRWLRDEGCDNGPVHDTNTKPASPSAQHRHPSKQPHPYPPRRSSAPLVALPPSLQSSVWSGNRWLKHPHSLSTLELTEWVGRALKRSGRDIGGWLDLRWLQAHASRAQAPRIRRPRLNEWFASEGKVAAWLRRRGVDAVTVGLPRQP